MAKMKGADIIAEYLVKEKVEYMFGVSGHGIAGLMDGIYDRKDKIKVITVRHEQAAAHMADAYFRIRHKPAATFTSCGPSSANLPMALACAMMDSSALLAITGDVPTIQFNRGPFQETGRHNQAEFPSTIRAFVKRSYQPTRVDMIPLAMRQAFKTMLTGRPGPVNLDVPLNCFQESDDVEVPDPGLWRAGISSRSPGDMELIEKALGLLLGTDKPCIIAGHGAVLSEAAPELRELVDLLSIPVATTANGKGIIPGDHPLSLGCSGRNGPYPANEGCRSCDVLLALGVKFDDRQSSGWLPGYTFSIPPTKLIHVEIDPDELARNYPPTLGILGDVKAFLRELLKLARAKAKKDPNRYKTWLNEIRGWKKEWEEFNKPNFNSTAVPIRPERLIHDLRQVMPRDAILVGDVGEHHNWLVEFFDGYGPGSMISSWGYGGMGFGVCGVLGAKLAAPDKACVCVAGDGGFTMTPYMLCTAVEYCIPVVWVIYNNFGHNVIRTFANAMWPNREIATRFQCDGEPYNPDFAALAKACGANGVRVEKPGDLKDALHQAITSNQPYVVDVIVETEAKAPLSGAWVLPPNKPFEPSYGKRKLRK
jgi:acetolactate synthase I/II/III large subunit